MQDKVWDCVVIGAGAAGMTAAMYLKRANIEVCIIEKSAPGGLLNKSSIIENYPGMEAMSGPDLALKFYKQITDLAIPYQYGDVLEIKDPLKDVKTIVTDQGTVKTKKIILAVGREPKKLNNTNQDRAIGHGVSFCSLCDGALYKGEEVALIGGGNSASEEALYLSKICKKVYILVRSNKLIADQILKERLENTANIEILYQTEVKDFVLEKDKLKELVITKGNEKEELTLAVKACFIFIGYTPATNFLKNLDILDGKGYINVDENKETKIQGIFAAGDVVSKSAYQVATATSDAIIAATKCIKELNSF